LSKSLHSLEDVAREVTLYKQIELPLEVTEVAAPEIEKICSLLSAQDEKLDHHHEYLKNLSQGLLEVLLSLKQSPHSFEEIDEIRNDVKILGKGFLKIYHYLEKENLGKELISLKSEQHALRKAIETSHKKPSNSVGLPDWKRTLAIVVSTAVLSSLCSVAIVQLIPNGWSHSANPTKPVSKKQVKSRN
jgi:hypothetical protein